MPSSLSPSARRCRTALLMEGSPRACTQENFRQWEISYHELKKMAEDCQSRLGQCAIMAADALCRGPGRAFWHTLRTVVSMSTTFAAHMASSMSGRVASSILCFCCERCCSCSCTSTSASGSWSTSPLDLQHQCMIMSSLTSKCQQQSRLPRE